MTQDVEVGREGAVMTAAFARPQKKNAITGAMYEALIEAFEAAERDSSVGALVLSGKGGVFTAGNDLGDFLAAASREGGDFPAWRFTRKLAEFEKPLVAAVDGLAIGIGTTLCFHCDLVYATPESRFQMPFVNLGLCPRPARRFWRRNASGAQKRRNSCCSPSRLTARRRAHSASSTPSCLRPSLSPTR
jgi:enoyl-CoA hydratase/carnithine racemase